MKKASVLLGIGLLGAVLISFKGIHKCAKSTNYEASVIFYEDIHSFGEMLSLQSETEILRMEDIVVIEEEEEIDLGFGTSEYLPIGFNAYEGMEFDLDEIEYAEQEEEIELGFDTAEYLPDGFNAYATATLNLGDIAIIEEEEEIDLGFDTAEYLPIGFNAYEGMEFDLDEIEYVELEEEILLNFDAYDYLLENLDADSK